MASMDLLGSISSNDDFKLETLFSDYNIKQFRDHPDKWNNDFLLFFYSTYVEMKAGDNKIIAMDGFYEWFRFDLVDKAKLSNDVYRVYLTIKSSYLEEIVLKLINSELPISQIKVIQNAYTDELVQDKEATYPAGAPKDKRFHHPSVVIYLNTDAKSLDNTIELLKDFDIPEYIAAGDLGDKRKKVSDLFYIADYSTTVAESSGHASSMEDVYRKTKNKYLKLKDE